MPRGREPEGQTALTNAERQARSPRPPADGPAPRHYQTPPAGAAKPGEALERCVGRVMIAVQAECAAWFEALPESLRDSATAAALQDMIDLDLDAIAAVQPPLGYGRD